jgi:hypothetical protein
MSTDDNDNDPKISHEMRMRMMSHALEQKAEEEEKSLTPQQRRKKMARAFKDALRWPCWDIPVPAKLRQAITAEDWDEVSRKVRRLPTAEKQRQPILVAVLEARVALHKSGAKAARSVLSAAINQRDSWFDGVTAANLHQILRAGALGLLQVWKSVLRAHGLHRHAATYDKNPVNYFELCLQRELKKTVELHLKRGETEFAAEVLWDAGRIVQPRAALNLWLKIHQARRNWGHVQALQNAIARDRTR